MRSYILPAMLSGSLISFLSTTVGAAIVPVISATVITTLSIKPCPTITSVTKLPICAVATPRVFCATPDCILLSTITRQCNCPATIPTSYSYIPCTSCWGGCATSYETIYPPCAYTTPSPTTTSKTVCPTITKTGPACPVLDCPQPSLECVVLSQISLNCACPTAVTSIACKTKCTQCETEYVTTSTPCVATPIPV